MALVVRADLVVDMVMRRVLPCIFALVASCRSAPEQVRTADVVTTDIQRSVTINGIAFPSGRTPVWPEVAGRISRILVERGMSVAKGQPLLELDRGRAQRDVEARQIALRRLEVAVLKASSRVPSESKTEDRQAALELELALLERDQGQKSLDDARLYLNQHTVKAPKAGIVVQANVRDGLLIAPGAVESAPYLAVADSVGVQIEAEGDEFETADIKSGMRAQARIDALGLAFDAVVISEPALIRLRTAGLASSQYSVRLEAKQVLSSSAWGMTTRVTIEVQRSTGVPSLPPDAIVGFRGQSFVVNSATKKVIPVIVGLCMPELCEIRSGPTHGTSVLRGGGDRLNDLVASAVTGLPPSVR